MQHSTIVIGAGPAGLAVAACLQRVGVDALILEQAEQVGAVWHRHYDRLHLHTAKAFSNLPGLPFPSALPRYPSRTQLLDYLERYAQHFNLRPRFGERVSNVRRDDRQWQVETTGERYSAAHVVVACGLAAQPHLPSWPGQSEFRGTLLHSSAYRNAAAFNDRRVLVVGFGNSGGEIALDLCEHGARVALAVRSPIAIVPRDLFGIPIQAIGMAERHLPPRLADALNAPILRGAIGDLRRYGIPRSASGVMERIRREQRPALIDVGTVARIRRGDIVVRPGVERFTADSVAFTDGRVAPFDAVILATGYRASVAAFVEEAARVTDQNGTPLVSGQMSALPGLFFCGYRVSPAGMLREIGFEAKRIAACIGHALGR